MKNENKTHTSDYGRVRHSSTDVGRIIFGISTKEPLMQKLLLLGTSTILRKMNSKAVYCSPDLRLYY